MHIGFDISQTGTAKAGCGHYAYSLISSLLKKKSSIHYSLYTSFGDFFFDSKISCNVFSGLSIDYGPYFVNKSDSDQFWNAPSLNSDLGCPDIVHSNNFWCPTQLNSSRLIYTLYDLSFLVNSEWTTEANRLGCFAGVYQASLHADWIIAISEYSKQQFIKIFPHFPKDRIEVIYPCSRFESSSGLGVRPKKLTSDFDGGYWLSIGTIEPRKNQKGLIEAYAKYYASSINPMPLVLAGGIGWMMNDFNGYVESFGIKSNVLMLGYVTDEELSWLYRHCHANLYPSFFEGFGLPVLEGLQFGVPTITSNTTSMPEVGGQAVYYVDPNNSQDLAKAMLELENNQVLLSKMKEASLLQASKFNLEDCATRLEAIYRKAIDLPKRHKT